MQKKKGFTLAELLITLTMVGIIATLVIPPVAQKLQEVQLKIAFKENYSIIDKAVQKAIQSNGGTFVGLDTHESYVDSWAIVEILAPYLNYVKMSGTSGVCWHPDNVLKTGDGSYWNNGTGAECLMLTNGAMLISWDFSGSCIYNEGGGVLTCGTIFIDVNGFKGPNVIGKDVFVIFVRKDRISPGGIQGATNENQCGAGTQGWGCAARVLMNQD